METLPNLLVVQLLPNKGKGNDKVHSRTGHEGPEGEQMYSSTLPSTSVLNVGGWSTPCPGRFTAGKDPIPHFIGGWMSPTAGMDGCGKSRPPTGIRSPDRPARSESLYRLSYPGPSLFQISEIISTPRFLPFKR